ncbi:hypothetical protein ACEUAI_24005 [Aeromonas veronii]
MHLQLWHTGVLAPTGCVMISYFCKGLARIPTQQLFELSALHQYRWDAHDANSPPITKEEIDFAISSDACIEPGLYVDNPEHNQMDNFLDCTRKAHIGRIAWFVKHYNPKLDCPVGLSITDYSACCLTGNHRLAAKLYLGINDIECEFQVGQIGFIEKFFSKIDWISKPATNHFGYNLIVENDKAWEVESHITPLKVYINSQDGCNLQLCINRGNIWARISNGDMVENPTTKLLSGPDISIEDVLEACSDVISPAFGSDEFKLYLEDNFYSKIPISHKKQTSDNKNLKA